MPSSIKISYDSFCLNKIHTKNQPKGECDNVKIKDKVGSNSYMVSVEKYFDCNVHEKKRLVSPFQKTFTKSFLFIYILIYLISLFNKAVKDSVEKVFFSFELKRYYALLKIPTHSFFLRQCKWHKIVALPFLKYMAESLRDRFLTKCYIWRQSLLKLFLYRCGGSCFPKYSSCSRQINIQ